MLQRDDPRAEELRARLEAQRAEFQKVVDEANAALKARTAELRAERGRREAAEAELENLKKGSIAMMRFVTNLQRKKHDEELETLRFERDAAIDAVGAVDRARAADGERQKETSEPKSPISNRDARMEGAGRGERGVEEGVLGAREEALAVKEARLARDRKEVAEQFQRLKEERELRRAEAEEPFTSAMRELPEMQKLVTERDEMVKALERRVEDLGSEVRRLRTFEVLARGNLGRIPEGAELARLVSAWEDEIVRLRHLLQVKEAELEGAKADFEVKLRNTIALQRTAYEKRMEGLGRMGPRRGPLWARKRSR